MIICFIGPASSSHIQKWCNWFDSHGHIVHLISFTNEKVDSAIQHPLNIKVNPKGNSIQKIKYFFTGSQIKKIINEINPDVISVHYATSYGVAMALSGVRNYLLSVWGSDIFVFPNKSLFHRILLKYSLRKAGVLLSTSRAMALEASKYTNKKFEITPFGVDTNLFNPSKRTRSDNKFVVGTVKTLKDSYGIRNILEAVSEVYKKTSIPICLRIAGEGPQAEDYYKLSEKLGIDGITTWLGFISQEQAASEWANMDVALIPSISESFGVSAVEAQACGTAVIVSDIPGLLESTSPGISSLIVKRNDSSLLEKAIIDLYENSTRRIELGLNGRKFVIDNYEIDACFYNIEKILKDACVK